MTSTSSDLTATSTQPLSKQPSVPNEAITRKRHTDSLAHECCAVNGCAGLNPAAYREVVEALRAICTAYPHVTEQKSVIPKMPDYLSPAGSTVDSELIVAGRAALRRAEGAPHA